jgi:hypothetical protein
MAEVELDREEAEGGCLPPVCMRCGPAATCLRQQKFQIGSSGREVKLWVRAPLCPAHRWHWTARSLAVPLLLVALLFASCAGVINVDKEHAGTAMLVCFGGFLLWCVTAAVLHYTSIHLRRITEKGVVLAGVAPAFVAALAAHRLAPNARQPLNLEGADRLRRTVRLFRQELLVLPPVCMRCGERATGWKEKTYSERKGPGLNAPSSLVGLASLAVVGVGWISFRSKRADQRLRAPLCDRHHAHWLLRGLAGVAAFFALPALGVVLLIALPKESTGWGCLATFLGLLLGFTIAVVLHETSIRAVEVTEGSLTLKGVSPLFAQAVEHQRRAGEQAFRLTNEPRRGEGGESFRPGG